MRALLLVILGIAAPTSLGCEGSGCRDLGKENFKVSMILDGNDLESIIEREHATNRANITCEEACNYAYNLERGWYINNITSCDSTIDASIAPDPDTPRGEVTCEGVGIEDYCD